MTISTKTHYSIILFCLLWFSNQMYSQSRMFIKERVVINPCPPCPQPIPTVDGLNPLGINNGDVYYYGDDLAYCYKVDSANNQAIISLKFLLEHWPNSYGGYAIRINAKDINNQAVIIASVTDTTLSGNVVAASAGSGGWYEVVHWDLIDREYKGDIEVAISNPLSLPGSGFLKIEFELGYVASSSQSSYTSYLSESVMNGHPCQAEGVANVLRLARKNDHSNNIGAMLSPNPVSENLEVSFKDYLSKPIQIKIIDMKGNMIFSTLRSVEWKGTTYSIFIKEVDSFASGIYSIILESNEIYEVRKFIKR